MSKLGGSTFLARLVYHTRNKLFGKNFSFSRIFTYRLIDFLLLFFGCNRKQNQILHLFHIKSERLFPFTRTGRERHKVHTAQWKIRDFFRKNKIHTSGTDTEVEGRIAWERFWDPFCFCIKRVFVCIDTGFPTGFPPTVAPNNVPPTSQLFCYHPPEQCNSQSCNALKS